MIHALKTKPATEPVTLSEMRAHIGITQPDDTSRDSIITGRIISARQYCEFATRQALITQTWVGYSDSFPSYTHHKGRIALKSPLISVTGVTYLDPSGTQQTLDPSLYLVDIVNACIVPAYGVSWPAHRVQPNSVQVEYVCGYGNAAAVPEPLKDAIRFIVSQWEVFQGAVEGMVRPMTIPNAAKELLNPYTDMREYF